MRRVVAMLVLVAVLAGLAVLAFRSDLSRPYRIGPLPDVLLRKHAARQIHLGYLVDTALAIGFGVMGILPTMFLEALILGCILGWPISKVWTAIRMKGFTVTPAGPDPSTEEAALFPSDKLAMLLSEGYLPPFPMWCEIAYSLAGVLIGVLFALAMTAIL
jgi:hypothetical protein